MGAQVKPAEQLGCGPAAPGDQLPKALRDILTKARTSWLRNSEVVDLLTNYRAYNFRVSKEAPVKPAGGSLFLFNRKTVRFFRKDGHEWRKKSDGKTIRETHEKLKVDNKDVLNCYYAHAEDTLQRRCYWLLDGDDNVVLVHYLSSGPHGNCVLRAPTPARAPSHGGATPLNAVEAPAPAHQQAVGTCATWQLAGQPSGGIARTASVPDNFGSPAAAAASAGNGQASSGRLPTVFTITTGDIVVRGTGAESSPEPDPAAPPSRQGCNGAAPMQQQQQQPQQLPTPFAAPAADTAYGGGGVHGVRGHDPPQRLDSGGRSASLPNGGPLPPSRSASGTMHGGSTYEDSLRLGPLHSAPSFSGGTVQTGSTVDLLDLQLQRSGGGGVSSAAAAALDGAGMQHGGVSSSEHLLAPALRLEFKGQPREGPAAALEALHPGCALELQDISLTLPPSGCMGRLSRDTSTTLAGGLQRRADSSSLTSGGRSAPAADPPLEPLPVLEPGVRSWG